MQDGVEGMLEQLDNKVLLETLEGVLFEKRQPRRCECCDGDFSSPTRKAPLSK